MMANTIDLDLPFEDLVRLHPDHTVVFPIPVETLHKEEMRLILILMAANYEGWGQMNMTPMVLEALAGRRRQIAENNDIFDYRTQPHPNGSGSFDIIFVFASSSDAVHFKILTSE